MGEVVEDRPSRAWPRKGGIPLPFSSPYRGVIMKTGPPGQYTCVPESAQPRPGPLRRLRQRYRPPLELRRLRETKPDVLRGPSNFRLRAHELSGFDITSDFIARRHRLVELPAARCSS